MRLLQARVPVKHLVYGGTATKHNDFVFQWRPLPFPRAGGPQSIFEAVTSFDGSSGNGVQPVGAAADGAGAAGTSAGGGGCEEEEAAQLATLPPFARDLMLILLGRVQVRFLTSLPGASKL